MDRTPRSRPSVPLGTQSAQTLMKAAFEGHPVTIHRNCIRENPLYVPKSDRL